MMRMEEYNGGGGACGGDDVDASLDTVTSANTNRAASKKLFQQLQHLNNRPLHAVTFSEPQMLHRSPSGAQKKIRQRQEQRWLKATASASSSSPSSSSTATSPSTTTTTTTTTTNVNQQHQQHSTTPSDSGGYRSLIDSGAYRSILPDEPPPSYAFMQPSSLTPRKLSAPLSCSLTSLDSTMSSTVSVSSTPITSMPTNSSFSGGKPMVEVHPMPSQQQQPFNDGGIPLKDPTLSLSSNTENATSKPKEKPRVPKKPTNLVLNNSSSRLNSPSLNALSLSSTSLNIPFASLTPSQSYVSVNRLFSTPSLICLHTALTQSDLSEEELGKVEAKRQKLVESLSKKIAVLDEERSTLFNEIESNEARRRGLVEELTLAGCIDIIERMHVNLAHSAQLIRLETKLRMQLQRLEGMLNGNMDGIDKDAHSRRMERVKSQISDQSVLKEAFDRRDARLNTLIESRITKDSIAQWRFYKETWKKLTAEQQEIEERLQLARDQLNALQNVHSNV